MIKWELARKELYRRRYSTLTCLCLLSLAVLCVAVVLPRTWSTTAAIEIRAQRPEHDVVTARLQSRLRSASAAAQHRVTATVTGSDLELRYTAPDAQAAQEGLNALLSRLVTEEIELLRTGYRDVEQALLLEIENSEGEVRASEMRLSTALQALPEGGEPALGAQLGKLRAEMDTLDLDLRKNRELSKSLGERISTQEGEIRKLSAGLEPPAALDQEISRLQAVLSSMREAGSADAARMDALESEISRLEAERTTEAERQAAVRARIDGELRPALQQAVARRAILDDEIRMKTQQQVDVGKLHETAVQTLATVRQSNEEIQRLQREYDDAVALNRQTKLKLRGVQGDVLLRTSVTALPFEIVRRPQRAGRPDGIPAWVYALASIGIGLAVSLSLNLGRLAVDDRVRIAESIRVDAQVPVLAVIPEYTPRQTAGQARLSVIAVLTLVVLTVGAHLLFLGTY